MPRMQWIKVEVRDERHTFYLYDSLPRHEKTYFRSYAARLDTNQNAQLQTLDPGI